MRERAEDDLFGAEEIVKEKGSLRAVKDLRSMGEDEKRIVDRVEDNGGNNCKLNDFKYYGDNSLYFFWQW